MGLIVICNVATAEPSQHYDLTWQAPAGCPEPLDVSREIDELTASSSATPPRSTVIAYARVTPEEGGFGLQLLLRDDAGAHERKLEAPACNELAHATALIVALAIDPTLLATHPEPEGTPAQPNTGITQPSEASAASASPGASVTPVLASPAPLPIATPDAEPNPPLFWRLGLTEFVAINTLPGAHWGTGLFGGVQAHAWRFEAGLSVLGGDVRGNPESKGANFSLYRFGTRACWLAMTTPFAFGPCVGAEVGLIRGKGYGVALPNEQTAPWLDATAGALVDWRISSSSVLGIVGDVELPWRYYSFELANERLYKPPALGARIGLSLAAGWQ